MQSQLSGNHPHESTWWPSNTNCQTHTYGISDQGTQPEYPPPLVNQHPYPRLIQESILPVGIVCQIKEACPQAHPSQDKQTPREQYARALLMWRVEAKPRLWMVYCAVEDCGTIIMDVPESSIIPLLRNQYSG